MWQAETKQTQCRGRTFGVEWSYSIKFPKSFTLNLCASESFHKADDVSLQPLDNDTASESDGADSVRQKEKLSWSPQKKTASFGPFFSRFFSSSLPRHHAGHHLACCGDVRATRSALCRLWFLGRACALPPCLTDLALEALSRKEGRVHPHCELPRRSAHRWDASRTCWRRCRVWSAARLADDDVPFCVLACDANVSRGRCRTLAQREHAQRRHESRVFAAARMASSCWAMCDAHARRAAGCRGTRVVGMPHLLYASLIFVFAVVCRGMSSCLISKNSRFTFELIMKYSLPALDSEPLLMR